MDALIQRARELLESGTVQVIIGFGRGSGNRVRPVFARQAADADRLVFDSRCTQNLAVYLLKQEVKSLGRSALVATLPAVRSVLQLAAENQLGQGPPLVLAVSPAGELAELKTLDELEKHIAAFAPVLSPEDQELLARIEAMSTAERWEFWQREFAKCFKCYACRAACSMCYCSRCVVEDNQPQWVPVPSHARGNLEWHIVRAMHLAGRCVGCGECGRACPMGIPLHVLSWKIGDLVARQFGQRAGFSATADYPLSRFLPDDHESFIR